MSTLATLVVKLVGDVADYQQKMTSAGSTLDRISGKMTGAGKALSIGVTAPIVAAGVAAVNAASDFEESKNKVLVVFDDMSSTITDFSKNAVSDLGMTQQAALEYAGTFGNLFDSMGIAKDVNAEMSTSLLTLAADLASFNNIDPTLALEKLRAGLVGEVEPLRSLGVNLNQTMLEAKAVELGLTKMVVSQGEVESATRKLSIAQMALNKAMTTNDPIKIAKAQENLVTAQDRLNEAMRGTPEKMDAAAKAQAAYAIIMEQTANAQGDFSRTSDGLANSQRILKAQFGDLLMTLGQELLPVALSVVSAVRGLLDGFTGLDPSTRKIIIVVAGLAAAIGPVLLIMGSLISAITTIAGVMGPVSAAIGGVVALISGPVLLVIGLVVGALALLYLAWKNNWGGIQEKTKAVVDWIKTTVGDFLTKLKTWWNDSGNFIANYVKGMWEVIKTVFQTAINVIKTVFEAFRLAFQGDWRGFGEKLREAWNLVWSGIKQAASMAWDNIKTFFANAVKNIWSTIVNTDWLGLGRSIIQGIVNGLMKADSTLRNALLNLARNALNAFKGFFGIHSPSAVMTQQAKNLVAGLVNGLDSGAAITAIRGLYNDMSKEAQALQLSPNLAPALGGIRPSQANQTNIVNYNVTGNWQAEQPEDLIARLRLISLMEGR